MWGPNFHEVDKINLIAKKFIILSEMIDLMRVNSLRTGGWSSLIDRSKMLSCKRESLISGLYSWEGVGGRDGERVEIK